MELIGVGIVTCNRLEFFKQSHWSVIEAFRGTRDEHKFIVVNDGDPYRVSDYDGADKVIQHPINTGVGVAKNDALQYLLDQGCEHIFLIEDDIVVKNPWVFRKYIDTSKVSGLQHLMYGYHGPANKVGITPHPRLITMHSADLGVAFNQHCVGAFCYYTRKCLEECGLNDDKFVNAFEHVEHTYRLHKAGYTSPYWWFPDVYDSYDYLDELACSEVNSTIRPRADWQSNIQNAFGYFKSKHGVSPVEVPDSTQAQVVEFLKRIKP